MIYIKDSQSQSQSQSQFIKIKDPKSNPIENFCKTIMFNSLEGNWDLEIL
jgi:hypothetical protein